MEVGLVDIYMWVYICSWVDGFLGKDIECDQKGYRIGVLKCVVGIFFKIRN